MSAIAAGTNQLCPRKSRQSVRTNPTSSPRFPRFPLALPPPGPGFCSVVALAEGLRGRPRDDFGERDLSKFFGFSCPLLVAGAALLDPGT